MIALGPTTQVSLIKHEATIIMNLNIGEKIFTKHKKGGMFICLHFKNKKDLVYHTTLTIFKERYLKI
jgi:hypothetical protein